MDDARLAIQGSERRRFYSSRRVPFRASATASAPVNTGWYSKFVLWLHKVMGMGWESYSETMDREDGFIDVLVGQGDSRRGADHDVPGDKRGPRMLEIRSETYRRKLKTRQGPAIPGGRGEAVMARPASQIQQGILMNSNT